MNTQEQQNPEAWASHTFGLAELGDPRRTDRLVRMAAAIAHDPAASLPKAMRSSSETTAASRFLDNEQIMMPHWIATQHPCVLLGADTTAINLSTHTTTKGVSPMGQGLRGRGFYVHTVVALRILTPIALRLLVLREMAQKAPEIPATEVVSLEGVQVVAHLSHQVCQTMSANLLWRTIASFGGSLNRTSDGSPGWKTL